jgi:two-component system, OmpR family, sensor histidine kinase CiaH
MFDRARRRLTLQAALLFAAVLLVFSVVFYSVLTTVLAPTFDIAPEIPNDEAARNAYQSTVELIAAALIIANIVAIGIAVLAGYVLAGRTLRPIRNMLDRQRRFVADASHEMRTPLTVIRATVDGALQRPDEPELVQASLRTVSDATDRLTRMTSDLLLLARTEDSSLAAIRTPIDLSVAAAEAASTARQAIGAHIELTLEPDLLVLADEDALQRIAANLIDNAWRYSEGKVVRVRTSGTDRIAVLEVEDHGPGIAEADRERVFEPFHRVRADHDTPPGSGLGLAIARGLTHGLGGRIGVDSRPGTGSTFRVELPRDR